jgi:phosphonate transport system ATP-binding protein
VAAGRVVFEGRPDELTDEVLQRIYPGGLDTPAAAEAPPAAAVSAPTPVAAHAAPQLALEQS